MIKNEQPDISFDITKWQIAKEYGWTLDYIDSLSLEDLQHYAEYQSVMEGVQKAQAFTARRKVTPRKQR